MEKPPSIQKTTKTAYYHDQRGVHHSPAEMIVPEFFEALDERIREEYLEGRKDVQEEVAKLEALLPLVKDDVWARERLASLIENCWEYLKSVKQPEFELDEDPLKTIERMRKADELRRKRHEGVMSDLKAIQEHVAKTIGSADAAWAKPEQILYTGQGKTRQDIGLWAMRFAEAIAKLSDEERSRLQEVLNVDHAQAAE